MRINIRTILGHIPSSENFWTDLPNFSDIGRTDFFLNLAPLAVCMTLLACSACLFKMITNSILHTKSLQYILMIYGFTK